VVVVVMVVFVVFVVVVAMQKLQRCGQWVATRMSFSVVTPQEEEEGWGDKRRQW